MFWRKKKKVRLADVISAGLKYETRDGMVNNLNREVKKLEEELNDLAAEYNSKAKQLEEKLDAQREIKRERKQALNEWFKLSARYRKQNKRKNSKREN